MSQRYRVRLVELNEHAVAATTTITAIMAAARTAAITAKLMKARVRWRLAIRASTLIVAVAIGLEAIAALY